MRSRSILILGSGVFGVTSAIELKARGWRVTLLDQGTVPYPDAASTDISKVVRMDYGADEIYTEMGEQSLDGWCRWNAAWEKPLYHADGFLVMTRDDEMKPGSFEHESFHFLQQRDHELRRVRRADLRKHHPAWNSKNYGDGYLNPNGGWAESGRVIARLKNIASRGGAEMHEGVGFGSLIEKGSKVVGVRSADGRQWKANVVLAATGAWTPFLFPDLQNVMHTTGQPVVHFKPKKPQDYRAPAFPVWGADIARTGWYGFPANADGIVKVANHGPGVRITDPVQPRVVKAEQVEMFRAFLGDTFPSLAAAEVAGTRLCWYCDTFDGHFWIDHHPHREGLVIAAGDSGHAFKFSPVLGGLVADVIERTPDAWARRFAWREAAQARSDGARAR
jgi:sarcosine oxidase / L-pipecolate oxidase